MTQVRAWLRMMVVAGDHPVPTSESVYKENRNLIDIASPVNGGVLQADGIWSQTAGASSAFALELPSLVEQSGQRYAPVFNPGHGSGPGNLQTVLDNAGLQATAISEAVSLATTRHDAPWDAAMYDVLGVDAAYVAGHEAFLLALGNAMRAAGVQLELACEASQPTNEDRIPSVAAMNAAADKVDIYSYNWRGTPNSLQPYWWAVSSIADALADGLPANDLKLGVAISARYWPDSSVPNTFHDITHSEAMAIVTSNGATVQRVDSDAGGAVCEKYATVGVGHLWIQDGDTVRSRLALVDEYGLGGVMLFTPGMGDESVWQAIAEWKQPAPMPPQQQRSMDRFYQATNWCA
jgi:spore germination protein YaaH